MIFYYIIFAFVIASLYAIFFFYLTIEWLKTRELFVLPGYKPVKFSIIIPFKNEADHLKLCLDSILGQNYDPDNFEIICVNDHSEDDGPALVSVFCENNSNVILVNNDLAGKKNAIRTGIAKAKYNHIITTDADTSRNKTWLAAFASMFNYKGIKVVAGSVLMIPRSMSPIHFFQAMDYCGSMAMSVVAMRKRWFRNGSGANMAFTKDVYLGYSISTIDREIASGDDVFLLQYAHGEDPKSVLFPKIRDLTVFTSTEPDWKSFLIQRTRWASKSFAYKEWAMTFLWAFIWMANLSIPVTAILAIGSDVLMVQLLAFSVMTKLLADFIFLKTVTNYYDKTFFKYFFIASLYHLNYVIIVGINALFRKTFYWKGAKIKN